MKAKQLSLEDKRDTFIFSISNDSGEVIQDQAFNIQILHEEPHFIKKGLPLAIINNKPIIVNALETSLIPSNNLNVVNINNSGEPVRFILRKPPEKGLLLLKEKPLVINSTFSQKNINEGHLCYQHNGKKAGLDSFVFGILDEAGELIESYIFECQISTTNTAPVFVHKGDLSLEAGETKTITNSLLSISDQEQNPDQLLYMILSAPQQGTLFNSSGGAIKQGSFFSQKDIDEEKINYVHNGVNEKNDSFVFFVTDGAGGNTKRSIMEIHLFEKGSSKRPITSSEESPPPDHALTEELKKLSEGVEDIFQALEAPKFPVNKGTAAVITLEDLHIYAENTPADLFSLSISITEMPTHGRLSCQGFPVDTTTPLPALEWIQGNVFYHHSDITDENDQFSFELKNPYEESLQASTLKISIVEEHKAPIMMEHHLLIVSKGSTLRLNSKLLTVAEKGCSPENMTFTITSPPKNGSLLSVTFGDLRRSDTFTQKDIDEGTIAYTHDGSDVMEDHFVVTIRDGSGGSIKNLSINFTITENSFALIHNAPLTLQAKESALITNNNLQAIHLITSNSKLKFTLKNVPSKGKLLIDGAPLEVGTTFTQDHISKGLLIYQHEGSL